MKPSRYDSPARIAGYEELALKEKYRWVDNYLKLRGYRAERRELRHEEQRIMALPLRRSDFEKAVHKSYDRLVEKRKRALVIALQGWRRENDPLQYFQHWQSAQDHSPLPEWREFEEALRSLPKDGIEFADRQAKLARLAAKIEKLNSKIKLLQEDKILKMAVPFVRDWGNSQQEITGPVGPFGTVLDPTSEHEAKAWTKLGLDKKVNKNGRFMPNPNPVKIYREGKGLKPEMSKPPEHRKKNRGIDLYAD